MTDEEANVVAAVRARLDELTASLAAAEARAVRAEGERGEVAEAAHVYLTERNEALDQRTAAARRADNAEARLADAMVHKQRSEQRADAALVAATASRDEAVKRADFWQAAVTGDMQSEHAPNVTRWTEPLLAELAEAKASRDEALGALAALREAGAAVWRGCVEAMSYGPSAPDGALAAHVVGCDECQDNERFDAALASASALARLYTARVRAEARKEALREAAGRVEATRPLWEGPEIGCQASGAVASWLRSLADEAAKGGE